jgi:hypothetical protein
MLGDCQLDIEPWRSRKVFEPEITLDDRKCINFIMTATKIKGDLRSAILALSEMLEVVKAARWIDTCMSCYCLDGIKCRLCELNETIKNLDQTHGVERAE